MKLFYYLYCIVFFCIVVVCALLLDFSDWCLNLVKRIHASIKRFNKRVYLSVLRCSWRFGKRCR